MKTIAHKIKHFPYRPILFMVVFISLQGYLVHQYLLNRDFIDNTKPSTVEHSFIPAIENTFKGVKIEARQASGAAQAIPVLVYHGVVDKPDGANVLVEDFKNQMFALKKAGYQAISLSDFSQFMKHQKQLPPGSFLLTFDDGRKDSYYPVDPILQTLGFHATMFVINEHAFNQPKRSTYYLNKSELVRMRDSGRWDIQAHTENGHNMESIDHEGKKGHFFSNLLWREDAARLESQEEFKSRVLKDLVSAKVRLEKELDIKVNTFAFPFGDYGQDTLNNDSAQAYVLEQVRSMYSYAFAQENVTTASYSQNFHDTDPILLKRIKVFPGWTGENLAKVISVGTPKDMPFFDKFTDYNGWRKSYGRMEISGNNSMVIRPSETGTSASVGLDGTSLWQNYDFSIKLNWQRGSDVTLVTRFKDENNFVACTFGANRIRVEQRINKQRVILQDKPTRLTLPKDGIKLLASVSDSQISCSDSVTTATVTAPVTPAHGGVGIKLWDARVGNAQIEVKEAVAMPQ